MDRFFSKLDLRDIKIKPEGSRFLPTDDDVETSDGEDIARASVEEVTYNDVEVDAQELHTNGYNYVVPEVVEPVEELEWEIPVASATPLIVETEANAGQWNNRPRIVVDDPTAEVLKVSAKSRPSAVAGAIAGVVRENGRAEVQAIGAGATNQAIKAIAIAREYLLETNIEAVCVPAFIDVVIDNEERTAIRLVIEIR